MLRKVKSLLSLRRYLRKLAGLKESPEGIARGLAIGVFVGFLPINGFQIITAVTIAGITRVSRVAAVIGTHVTNPWTTIPVLVIDYYIGCAILGKKACLPHVNAQSIHSVTTAGMDLLLPAFVGGTILGVVFSLISYFGLKKLLLKEIALLKSYMAPKVIRGKG
jgi:uncharacterized protein (DUF2062 family)